METAKVDIRKLQLLNDRINQCLDALNQVRLSVHGLSHTQANPQLGANPGYVDPRFYGMTPGVQGFGGAQGIGGVQGFGGGAQGFGGGLAHTPFIPPPVGVFPPVNPLNIGGIAGGFPSINPIPGQIPGWNVQGGLSHTGLEESIYNRPLWSDPMLATRVAQTFPFVQYGLPPLVPVY